MSDWKSRFHEFLAEFMREEHNMKDVNVVIGFYEETYQYGGCETCSYEVHELHIQYRDFDDVRRDVKIETRMEDLFY